MNIKDYVQLTGRSDSTVRRDIRNKAIRATKDNGVWNIESPVALQKVEKQEAPIMPPDIGDIRGFDWWQGHPAKNIDPTRVASLFLEAEQGFMWNWADFLDDMLERDPFIRSNMMVRKNAVLSKGWDVLPDDDSPKAQKQADFMKDVFLHLSDDFLVTADAFKYMGMDELLSYLLDAQGRSFSTSKLGWEIGDKWIVRSAEQVHQRHFVIGNPSEGEEYSPYELRLRTKEEVLGEPLPKYRYISHYDFSKGGYLTRGGLLRPSAWFYLYKHHGMKWFVRFAEIAAVPFMVSHFDPLSKTKEADLSAIKKALRDMGAAGYGILPKDADVEFRDASRGTGGNPQEQLLEYCDRVLTILWLGQTGVTMPVASKLGEEGVQQDVLFDIMQSDALSLMGTIQRSLIVPMAEFNDGEVLCHFDIPFKPEEDQKAIADTMKTVIVDIGLPVSEDYLYEKLGIPPPGENDVVVKPSTPANPFGFDRKVNNSRKTRLARDRKVRAGVDAIEDDAIESTLPLYNKLTSGVTEKNFKKKLESNKPAFKREFEKRAGVELRKVDKIFKAEFPKSVKNTIKIDWDLADKTALEFLEWQTFTMAQMEGEIVTSALITQIEKGLQTGLAEGETFATFLKTIKNNLGIAKVNPAHLSTVWRTNLATAHSASTFDQIQKGDFVGWEFLAVDDADQTDICNDRSGNKYPIDNTRDMPPLHFNCRSEASPFTAEEADEEKYQLSGTPAGAEPPDVGFKNLATTNYNNWVEKGAKEFGIEGVIKDGLSKIGA